MSDKDKLMETAIKFLRNPGIEHTTMSHRRSFLSSKGLTDDEIDSAVAKSGVGESPSRTDKLTNHQQDVPPALPRQTTSETRKGWQTFRNAVSFMVVIGGGVYILNRLYRHYIKPVVTKSDRAANQNPDLSGTDGLNTSIRDTLTSVQDTLAVIRTSLQQQQIQLEALTNTVTQSSKSENALVSNDRHTLLEVKAEVTSLKGLLLSRHQFPPTPKTKPALPSWQLSSEQITPSNSADPHQASDVSSCSSSQLPVGGSEVTTNTCSGPLREDVDSIDVSLS